MQHFAATSRSGMTKWQKGCGWASETPADAAIGQIPQVVTVKDGPWTRERLELHVGWHSCPSFVVARAVSGKGDLRNELGKSVGRERPKCQKCGMNSWISVGMFGIESCSSFGLVGHNRSTSDAHAFPIAPSPPMGGTRIAYPRRS